jgi:hypothetical protein
LSLFGESVTGAGGFFLGGEEGEALGEVVLWSGDLVLILAGGSESPHRSDDLETKAGMMIETGGLFDELTLISGMADH